MKNKCDVLILGAGFSGLSTSYHLGHERCVILEQNNHAFGHCANHVQDGVVWDEGPHVSFTKHEYVKSLFEKSVKSEYSEYDVVVGNYYKGNWINHPAQVNLYQVPEPLRNKCLRSFLSATKGNPIDPSHYGEWLDAAFGKEFSRAFPCSYTRKYWTCEPEELETSWVGNRVYRPNREDVISGAKNALVEQKHYITRVRYPKEGGYGAFGRLLAEGANIRLGQEVFQIDLEKRIVHCKNGDVYSYNKLVSSIPLPVFIRACTQVPSKVLSAVEDLACTSGYLVNVVVPHKAIRPDNWLYVYDEDKLSTRITFAEKLDGNEGERDYCALQVEVYHSRYRDLGLLVEEIECRVVDELCTMGLIDKDLIQGQDQLKSHITEFKWGNVIFDHQRHSALNYILNWLESFGLVRESDDLLSSTLDWEFVPDLSEASVVFSGRYAQWKYYWSDDCVLRGRQISRAWGGIPSNG